MNDFIFWTSIIIILGYFLYTKYNDIEASITNKLPYKKKSWLMTKAEKQFFDVLKEIVGNQYYIIPQVKISNLAYVPKIRNYQTYLNKIDRKTVDFVLFDENFSPIMAIELDDSSHDETLRKERDKFVDMVMESINLKIVHIKTAYSYNPKEIRKHIFETSQI